MRIIPISAHGLRAAFAATAAAILMTTVSPAPASACDVPDVGIATPIPDGSGGAAWLEADRLDQSETWSGVAHAFAADDSDGRILTAFAFLGGQYKWTSRIGLMAELPSETCSFTTKVSGRTETFRHTALGDLRLMGVYAGFTPTMSTGVTFGRKLPTGAFDAAGFDRDVQLKTGTIDLLSDGYSYGSIGRDTLWTRLAQAQWDHAPNSRAGYRLGGELQAKAWKIYGDVELPLYQPVNGSQLVAPVLFKPILSRSF